MFSPDLVKIVCQSENFIENEKGGNQFMQSLVNMMDGVEQTSLNIIFFYYGKWMRPCIIKEKHNVYPIDVRGAFS